MKLHAKIRENSWRFLRRAIKELIKHDDSTDQGLTNELAIFATTYIQISFELALVSHYLKKDGLRGIAKENEKSLTEDELTLKFESNNLNTKSFNTLKKQAIEDEIFLYIENDIYYIDNFQNIRNKLMHLNYEFDQNELYDLKYELCYFIVKIIIPILSEEYDRPSEAISTNLDSKDFIQLINFPPYAYEMNKIAKEHSHNVYACIHCGIESLATDYGDEHCYSCSTDFNLAGFIDCPYCKSKNSMIFDALNIEFQNDRTLKGLCLKCDEDDMIYHCPECDSLVPLEAYAGKEKCSPGFCEWE